MMKMAGFKNMKRFLLALGLLLFASSAYADTAPWPYPLPNEHTYALTIATGGTSQAIPFVFGTGIKTWCVQNPTSATESLWIDFGRAAVVGSSFEVPAGTRACMGSEAIWNGAINANATTSAHAFEAFEFQ